MRISDKFSGTNPAATRGFTGEKRPDVTVEVMGEETDPVSAAVTEGVCKTAVEVALIIS